MNEQPTGDGQCWTPAWTQAMSDFRGEDDEPGFDDVTVRMTVPAGLGGERVRAELSNRFGDGPVVIGRAAIGVGGPFEEAVFDGRAAVTIPAGEVRWTDPIELRVRHDDHMVVDVYLPEPTPYATAAGFLFDRSVPGDHVAAASFPLQGSADAGTDAEEPDGTGWSLPAGGPFLRTIEVLGPAPKAVVVAFGSSSTAMGWPQYTAALLPADSRITVVNRGISGNRILRDAPAGTPSWGRAGLARFDDDVLGTTGATHVVIAYNSNDWTLPGRVTPIEEMPTLDQLIDAYRQLIDRSEAAGLRALLATVTPLSPDLATDTGREGLRTGLNEWIRTCGHPTLDFDAALRTETDPALLESKYAAPDDTHPNINGEQRLARVTADALAPADSP